MPTPQEYADERQQGVGFKSRPSTTRAGSPSVRLLTPSELSPSGLVP